MRGLVLAVALSLAPGSGVGGQSQAQDQDEVQVGVPGCADDVPVRAWREPITFDSRGRSIRAHV